LLFFAEKNFHELDKADRRTEIQKIMQVAIRMANIVPDHKTSARLYEHQGILNSAWLNYPCAVRAFIKMKDVAEDVSDFETMMRAYLHLGKTLQLQCEYKKAILAFKCLL
jgi:predicted SAM-dependent methyltransferase